MEILGIVYWSYPDDDVGDVLYNYPGKFLTLADGRVLTNVLYCTKCLDVLYNGRIRGEFLTLADGRVLVGLLYCTKCLPGHSGNIEVYRRIRQGYRFPYPVYCSECHAPLAERYDRDSSSWVP